jgi:hypothetical protein
MRRAVLCIFMEGIGVEWFPGSPALQCVQHGSGGLVMAHHIFGMYSKEFVRMVDGRTECKRCRFAYVRARLELYNMRFCWYVSRQSVER